LWVCRNIATRDPKIVGLGGQRRDGENQRRSQTKKTQTGAIRPCGNTAYHPEGVTADGSCLSAISQDPSNRFDPCMSFEIYPLCNAFYYLSPGVLLPASDQARFVRSRTHLVRAAHITRLKLIVPCNRCFEVMQYSFL
jgi:hypothetical protein